MKKILSIIFAVIISLSLVTGLSTPADVKGASFETSGEIDYSQDSAKVSGIKYYYKDSYFYKDAYCYNDSLSTMSLCMSIAAFNSEAEPEYKDKSKNINKLYTELDFEDIYVNPDYEKKPSRDSIGVAMANKKLVDDRGKTFTLVAAAIRGGGYEREWAGNVTIGKSGAASGFSASAAKVFDYITEYIDSNTKGDIKIWITGYSRGGAVAGLTGRLLDDLSDKDADISRENIYVYTFEAPAAEDAEIADKEIYKNIFNIVNPDDIVPKVVMNYWGCKRPGEDIWLPSVQTDSDYRAKKILMQKHFDNISGKQAVQNSDFIKKNNKPVGVYCDGFLRSISQDVFKDRKDYSDNYESLIADMMEEITGNNSDGNYTVSLQNLMKINAMLLKVSKDTNRNININSLGDINSVYANLKYIIQNHYPEVCLAWLMSFDKNYAGENINTGIEDNKAGYREVRISSKKLKKITVFDGRGNEAACISRNKIINRRTDGIVCDYENGDNIFYLPLNQKYTINAIAKSKCKVSIFVNGYSFDTSEYYNVYRVKNVNLKKQKTISMFLGKSKSKHIDATSDTVYSVKNGNKKIKTA